MNQEGDTADRQIAQIAERQHGAVTVEQLRSAGISSDAIKGRLRKGRIHRLHRGVYALGHARLSREGRWIAAVLACGRRDCMPNLGQASEYASQALPILQLWGAALSHQSAASLWGMLPPQSGQVHVTVPGTAGRKPHDGIRLHRSRTLKAESELVTSRAGIPVTTPARTIADLRRSTSPAEVRQAIRQAEVLGLRIEEEAVPDHTRSELEALFLHLCARFKLPPPEVNVPVGPFLVDFLWRDKQLIVETDGYRHHGGREAFEADRDRDLRLKVMGYDLIRLSYRQVTDEPRVVADTLTRLLADPQALE